jgi:ATP-dependent exoDNAse (exonuclease V) beta subunit
MLERPWCQNLCVHHMFGMFTKLRACLQEERRLLYVAMSRAKHRLLISHVVMEPTTNTSLEPSRFLAEIGSKHTQKSQKYDVQTFPKHMETVRGSKGAFITAKSVHKENNVKN